MKAEKTTMAGPVSSRKRPWNKTARGNNLGSLTRRDAKSTEDEMAILGTEPVIFTGRQFSNKRQNQICRRR